MVRTSSQPDSTRNRFKFLPVSLQRKSVGFWITEKLLLKWEEGEIQNCTWHKQKHRVDGNFLLKLTKFYHNCLQVPLCKVITGPCQWDRSKTLYNKVTKKMHVIMLSRYILLLYHRPVSLQPCINAPMRFPVDLLHRPVSLLLSTNLNHRPV